VALLDALERDGTLVAEGAGYGVTPDGFARLRDLGVDVDRAARGSRRPLARPCADWTEGRAHLAGALGAALAERLLDAGWIRRIRPGRALEVTPKGRAELGARFGIT
jgi:hypothetical protein